MDDKKDVEKVGRAVKDVFERVMPSRTITGKKTDKPQFPSRMDGMDRAQVRKVERPLRP